MELLTSIIDLDSIKLKKPPFTPTDKSTQIEALANTIIELGGLVNVPVVQQISVDEYELISGYLEYYAYLKARELNSSMPDRMTVFVSNNKNKVAIRQQLEILDVIEDTKQDSSQTTTSKPSDIDLRIKNLESSINHNNKLVFTAIEQQKAEILAAIEAKLPQPIPPLEALNRILEPEIALQVQRKLEFIGASKAKKVVALLQETSKRENHQTFQSFAEIVAVLKVPRGDKLTKLISEGKMMEIIDRWNY